MAECHPVAFRWPMKAKVEHGAKLIHVDPRFTRTSAMCDIYAPIRAGSDIAFLGGLINYVINSERWNTDPFFQEYVLNYTNAATIVREDFKGTEELDGVFSGLMEYKRDKPGWAYDGFLGPVPDRLLAVRHARATRWASPGAARRTRHPGARRRSTSPSRASRSSTSSRSCSSRPPARDPSAEAPALRVPARQAPLQPLHAGDGASRSPAARRTRY